MIAAIGPISRSVETAIAHLAACPAYRAFLGVDTEAKAIARTYSDALPAPTDGQSYTKDEWEETLRPFGIVYASSAAGYKARRVALYTIQDAGRIYLELETTIPIEYKAAEDAEPIDLTANADAAGRWITNQVGQIVDEFMAMAGQPGKLDATQMTVMMGPSREGEDEQTTRGLFYWVLIEIVWGEEG